MSAGEGFGSLACGPRAGTLAALAVLVAVACLRLGESGIMAVSGPPSPGARLHPPRHRIDLSTAPVAELALLPEIGPSLAARIVADRAAVGPFGSVDDLARVGGIGAARIEALREDARAGFRMDLDVRRER